MRGRPLLAKNCYGCHTSTHMGGLQLDSREHVLKGGNNGPAIVPGDPEHSVWIQDVQYTHPRFKMPPTGKLKDAEIADLTAWIKSGAEWGTPTPASKASAYTITAEQRAFWSFQPVRRSLVPAVKDKHWIQSPIDNFVLAKLEAQGLRPAGPAGKRTLIPRATDDLTGLPPSPDEGDAIVNDPPPNALPKAVDPPLPSPPHGEPR